MNCIVQVVKMVDEKTKRQMGISPKTPATSIATLPEQTGFLSRGLDSIFDDFRRSFDDLLKPFFPLYSDYEQAITLPPRYAPVDLVDNGDHYLVSAELPGFNKDQVDVQINNDGLSIIAECKEEKETKRKNYMHRERAYSSMQRFVTFPEEVAPDKVVGTMKEGVLELKIPKKEPKPEEKPRKVELK